MYLRKNSTNSISKHRLVDGIGDCLFDDDETINQSVRSNVAIIIYLTRRIIFEKLQNFSKVENVFDFLLTLGDKDFLGNLCLSLYISRMDGAIVKRYSQKCFYSVSKQKCVEEKRFEICLNFSSALSRCYFEIVLINIQHKSKLDQ